MNWTFVAKLEKGGHRIFRAPNGRLAIADNSGEFPDTTDDGVLWLRTEEPLELHQPNGDHLSVSIPLRIECDRPGCAVRTCLHSGWTRTCTGPDGAIWLLRNRIFTKIVTEDGAPSWLKIIAEAFDRERPTEDRVCEVLAK